MTVIHDVRITILGLEWLEPLLARINWKLDKIMATESELDAKLDELQTEMDAAKARDAEVAAKLDEALKLIAELQTGQPDLTDELARVSALVDEAKTIAQPPAPEPAPEA